MRIQVVAAATAVALASGAAADAQPAVPAPTDPLRLTCNGDRIAIIQERTHVSISRDYDVTHDQDGTTVTEKTLKFPARVDVEALAGGGRIRLPSAMIPAGSAPPDLWFPIEKLAMDADKITGQMSAKGVGRYAFRIDRHTGEIDLRGSSAGFSGMCVRSAQAAEATKF